MAGISTHILNASVGQPAVDVVVKLLRHFGDSCVLLDTQHTDQDGRIKAFDVDQFEQGNYQLVFEVAAYFEQQHVASFYPRVCIDFKVVDETQHYHVPLLISPFSYSTYRGS
ncbi:hydroxyisourate hydrolase [Acinetobacter zhairhuonensis]|uniref:hydroxyisourate hydrolase n=1 Tax=Acinetobacter sp. A7.4 TaxID=2919921 RepID=UPI001F4D5967|nr:hydroxyisourate hydrolase [Acinetobacter sp. A7.4]MCJ8159953.1 hydroxyisourate hydrolase [Acinetobacter sp. A7.4]